MRGVEQVQPDNGMRKYTGVLADPVTSAITTAECQLPRLNHNRGGQYIPSVVFRAVGGLPILRVDAETLVGARYQDKTFRSIIIGLNASRFLDGGQRTIILDKGLLWLEAAADQDKIDTVTSVSETEFTAPSSSLDLFVRASGRSIEWKAHQADAQYMSVAVYASTGQKIAEFYSGSDTAPSGVAELSSISAGCYHVIAASEHSVVHRAIIVR
jgi:hypothetical protein